MRKENAQFKSWRNIGFKANKGGGEFNIQFSFGNERLNV